MKLKYIAGLSIFGLFLLYLAAANVISSIRNQKEVKRLLTNQNTLTDSLTFYKDQAGKEAARVKTLEYTVAEFRQVMPEVVKELKNLKVKPSRVESFSTAGITQEKKIVVINRDTNIIINQVVRPVKSFTYSDPWYKISGLILEDSSSLKIQSADTIVQVVSWGPRKKPWLLFFSRRELVQTIQSKNPFNHIVFSRYIQVKK